jgi:hypothetical protein
VLGGHRYFDAKSFSQKFLSRLPCCVLSRIIGIGGDNHFFDTGWDLDSGQLLSAERRPGRSASSLEDTERGLNAFGDYHSLSR